MSMNGFHTHGNNLRNGKTTFPHVVKRQEAAKLRQAEADKRTPEDQLKALDRAGLVATKERAKLAQRIADRNKPKPALKAEAAPQAEKKPKLTKEQRRAKRFSPFDRTAAREITAEDAEKLKGTPVKFKPLVEVEIGK